MGELGDLLELLHDAHAHLTTLEVEYRDWGRQRRSNELAVVDSAGGKPRLSWRGGHPWPGALSTSRRMWLVRPGHLRVEILDGEAVVRLGIRSGAAWWVWDANRGTRSGSLAQDETGVATLPRLLAPPLLAVQQLMARMRLEPAGTGERAGRQVVRALGHPRQHPTSRGTLSYELEFDAEHGSLLRRAEFEDGALIWERQAQEVSYGSEIDPRCFVFIPPEEG